MSLLSYWPLLACLCQYLGTPFHLTLYQTPLHYFVTQREREPNFHACACAAHSQKMLESFFAIVVVILLFVVK